MRERSRPEEAKSRGQKQRLKFAYEETAEAVRDGDSSAKLNRMDADGVNFRHNAQKKRNQKLAHTEAEKKNRTKEAFHERKGLSGKCRKCRGEKEKQAEI